MIKLNNDIHIAFGYCGALKDWVANDHKKINEGDKIEVRIATAKRELFS